MKSGFLDRRGDLRSPLARLDARAKLVGIFLAVVILASEPAGALDPFPLYFGLILALAVAAGASPALLAKRALAASPFILAAAALPLTAALIGDGDWRSSGGFAASILLRAYGSILLLTLLIAVTEFPDLLDALRRLRAPASLALVTALMYRYVFLLLEEWRRLSQARDCRSAGRLRLSRASVYGKQIGLTLVRSWERSERVHAAMTVRGFKGELPLAHHGRFTVADALFASVVPAAFLAVRLIPAWR